MTSNETQNEIDKAAEIAKARKLVKQAAAIVKRLNLRNKLAGENLADADKNLLYPDPVLVSEWPNGRKPENLDMNNVYVDLPTACRYTSWSKTMIRKLVNDGILEQEHRGMYNLVKLVRAVVEYHEDGIGK